MRSRLRKFPKLDDAEDFEKAWSNLEAKVGSTTSGVREKMVHQKLKKGLLGSAFKLLKDTLGVAPSDTATISKLKALHPEERENLWPIRSQDKAPKITKEKVIQCIMQTSKETAGGISGLDGGFLNVVRHNEDFRDLMVDITKRIA